MSNLQTATGIKALGTVLALWAMWSSLVQPARAEGDPIDAWARWYAGQTRYVGPVLSFPGRTRPSDMPRLAESSYRAVTLHAPERTTPTADHAGALLDAFERAADLLDSQGWPLPPDDGGHGGSAGFDVYASPGAAIGAMADLPLGWSLLDGGSVFATFDSTLAADALDACAVAVACEAGLLSRDPAEDEVLRRATAAFAAQRLTGSFGCEDSAVGAQRHPERGILDDDADGQAAGALFLSLLSERHDGGSGRFVRDIWDFARQKSERVDALHASPSFLQALDRALSNGGDSLDAAAAEFAVARLRLGPGQTGATSAYRTLDGLPADAAVPVIEGPPYAKLPRHLPTSELPLRSFGSAYLRVDTRAAGARSQLKVWLRGELGARWGLVAVRVSERGRELGRVEAPARRVPRAYLPIELDAETAGVILVVHKLPLDWLPLPDPEADEHHYQLILDKN